MVTIDHKKESKPGENPEVGGGGCDDSDIEDCPPKFKLEDSSKLFSENIPSSLQEADQQNNELIKYSADILTAIQPLVLSFERF